MIFTSASQLDGAFALGQVVSTIRRIGSTTDGRALWDVCCSGRIVERIVREGDTYYRTDDPRFHWHGECEVRDGESAAMVVSRLNRAALGTR